MRAGQYEECDCFTSDYCLFFKNSPRRHGSRNDATRARCKCTLREKKPNLRQERSVAQMAEDKRAAKPDEGKKPEVDFGIGKFSLGGVGGILEGLGKLIDSVSKTAGESGGIVSKTGDIKGLGDKAKGVYGFTVRTLAGGEAKVEPFGNIRKTPKGPVVEEVREPIVDVFDEKDQLLVVAELPGVAESDINLEVKGDILTLCGERGEKKYSKEVLLPSKVDEKTLSSTYKNGILEIRIKKISGEGGSASGGEKGGK